jgi:Protein of unknown function (DUF2934)
VPRKTKTPSKEIEPPSSSVGEGGDGPLEKPVRRAPAKAKKLPTKKTAAKRAAKTSAAPAGGTREPTDEEIRLRAYFIAERRHRFALPGDAESDWLEAKRQLLSETGQR